jgi:thiosulfate/3-mercaptopyruvate sulfurtransferase
MMVKPNHGFFQHHLSSPMNRPLVSAAWLSQYSHDPKLIILNASLQDNKSGWVSDFAGIQIENARYFDLKNDFSDPESDLPNMLPSPADFEAACRRLGINRDSSIVVYDDLGVYSSPRVWWMFRAMGHRNVAVLDGGLPAWVAEGFEIEELQERAYAPGNFVAHFHPEQVKSMAFVAENMETADALVIDARSAGRFQGTAPEPRKDLPSGHIPGSVNLPFEAVLEEGKFKSTAKLRTLFEELEIDDRPLIFSCGSGLTACITLLASELVNQNPTSVFDGSWTEWAQSENLPI